MVCFARVRRRGANALISAIDIISSKEKSTLHQLRFWKRSPTTGDKGFCRTVFLMNARPGVMPIGKFSATSASALESKWKIVFHWWSIHLFIYLLKSISHYICLPLLAFLQLSRHSWNVAKLFPFSLISELPCISAKNLKNLWDGGFRDDFFAAKEASHVFRPNLQVLPMVVQEFLELRGQFVVFRPVSCKS